MNKSHESIVAYIVYHLGKRNGYLRWIFTFGYYSAKEHYSTITTSKMFAKVYMTIWFSVVFK